MAYASTTRATLRARLQDHYTGDPFWSATEANDAINEAMRQFNLYTGYWRGSVVATTTANSPFLSMGATLTYRTRVTRAGLALAKKSILEFYRGRRDWRTQTTATGGAVPTTVREWAPIGLNTIAIWPADAAGGLSITIEAVKITPVLTADGQFVDLGDEEQQILLDEALWILSFKRPSLMAGLKAKHQEFLQACLARNDQLRASAFYRHALGLPQQQRQRPTATPVNAPPEPIVTPNRY